MSDVTAVENLVKKHRELKQEIAKIIIGQEQVIDEILLSIYSGGHALLIGVPGLAKTLLVNTISQILGLDFNSTVIWLEEHFPELEVETRTLDSYEFDQLDFMKIDVEWFELRVLQGAENTIRKHKPIMYIEMHDTQAYTFIKNLDLNYRILYSHGADRLYKVDTSHEWKQHINKIDKLKRVLKNVVHKA